MSRLKKEEIQKFLDGDDSVFPEIFAAYRNKINYLAIEILRNQADCEEVVQNTFIKIITKRKDLRDASAFNTWIYRIAYNDCMDIYRQNKKGKTGMNNDYTLENYSDNKGEPNDVVSKKAILEAIQSEIDGLPEDMKQVCLLRFVGECSLEEISEIMSIPKGTVKSRLNRAKVKLREGLVDKHVTPAIYMSLSFTPLVFKLYASLVKQQEMQPLVETKVAKVIENATGVTAGVTVASGGMIIGFGSAVIGTSILLALFGTYTIINPIIDQTAEVVKIEEINYLKDLTNENLQIVLMFSGEPDAKDISITFVDENTTIEAESVDNENYMFVAKANGTYHVEYGGVAQDIKVDNIDKQSPKLKSLEKEEGLLKIIGSDDFSGIDFDKSYVEEGSNKFDLIKIDDTSAFFKDAVKKKAKLYLYDKVGNYQVYEINATDTVSNTDG
ncbi:RNA polymerase sigma factor (sigma-70 family) [Breznakia sp. PF5-3]|uniref:RNA polymerase sigma factor n=1 Tax=unclassified Breznakia TaxID=2623764 RepID=UPI0024057EEF|nr:MULTISPECIES: RNA polymerase sigma factor [unclassified Breznakia]MDF9824228.1 RNA polymerase sigma factor (sigma-70 family) [Breznakia sp. PM6-1]MDF9835026.1 RNA polymerase sigma factor (sigma-70 family) [Breznakia sp. PF5-3]MDF9837271.1 RNA polymerase sigma factor (sigma-70 family) [Breznakia sp. PFB2-8]MDF9859261.1 RNA polymerase sigma factor (sigma-70 family) [Breznakia sp. PH5-24]